MSNTSLPKFKAIEDALETLGAQGGAAQTHGLLSALLSGGAPLRKEAWLASMLSSANKDNADAKAASKVLLSVHEVSTHVFTEDPDEFALLLPDDETDLPERIQALADWSQGFVSGLNFIGVKLENNTEGDIGEALNDLVKISCLQFEAEELSDEDAENAYMELSEYAKIAVLLLHAEQANLKKDTFETSGNDTVH
jgi:yecA family protein